MTLIYPFRQRRVWCTQLYFVVRLPSSLLSAEQPCFTFKLELQVMLQLGDIIKTLCATLNRSLSIPGHLFHCNFPLKFLHPSLSFLVVPLWPFIILIGRRLNKVHNDVAKNHIDLSQREKASKFILQDPDAHTWYSQEGLSLQLIISRWKTGHREPATGGTTHTQSAGIPPLNLYSQRLEHTEDLRFSFSYQVSFGMRNRL